MYVFDTDHFSVLQNEPTAEQTRLLKRIKGQDLQDFFVPIISFQEQIAGWNALLNRTKERSTIVFVFQMFERIVNDFARAQILSFDDRAATLFDELRSRKIRIGTSDLRIASIAMSRGMILLTRNTIDFARVPGLSCEDWTIDDI
jgi:tRNA(fMet)-specific endonuclease VapC